MNNFNIAKSQFLLGATNNHACYHNCFKMQEQKIANKNAVRFLLWYCLIKSYRIEFSQHVLVYKMTEYWKGLFYTFRKWYGKRIKISFAWLEAFFKMRRFFFTAYVKMAWTCVATTILYHCRYWSINFGLTSCVRDILVIRCWTNLSRDKHKLSLIHNFVYVCPHTSWFWLVWLVIHVMFRKYWVNGSDEMIHI